MVKAYSGRLSPLCAGLVLLACSCQTRNFALQKSETGQESEKSPPALPIVWDDEGPAEGYEMQAPKLYLAVYDRFRQNPDGNFAVPEFKPQARKLLALLRSVQDRLNANEFPLRILVPKDFPGAQKKIESIKSSVTKECFVGAAEKVQKLLMPPEGREFTYASFWTGFRLASRAMVNPCPIANGEDVQEVRRPGNTDAVRNSFYPFPFLFLPVVGAESSIEHFNALQPYPIFIVGIDDVILKADSLNDPQEFVGHDIGHAWRQLNGAYRKRVLDPIFSPWTGMNPSELGLHLIPAFASIEIDPAWEPAIWRQLAQKSKSATAFEAALAPRIRAMKCVRNSVKKSPNQALLNATLFDLYHERDSVLPLLKSDPYSFFLDSKGELGIILQKCAQGESG